MDEHLPVNGNGKQNGKNGTAKPDGAMGRPRLEISRESFEALCSIQATLGEIAQVFDCSEDTVERRCREWYGMTFAEVFREKRKLGFVSLRRTLWEMAKTKENIAKFLSKNYIGLKEEVGLRHSGSIDIRSIKVQDLTFEQQRRIANGEPVEEVLANRMN